MARLDEIKGDPMKMGESQVSLFELTLDPLPCRCGPILGELLGVVPLPRDDVDDVGEMRLFLDLVDWRLGGDFLASTETEREVVEPVLL